MPVEALALDQRVVVRQTTEVDADLDALVEGGDPPRHGAAQRQTERGDARGVDVGPGLQVVERADAVVEHHAPQHLAAPEHELEERTLRAAAALAKHPVLDAERGVALGSQHRSIGRLLERIAPADELLLTQRVVAAVCVVVEHGRERAIAVRPRKVGGHRLLAVEIECQPLQDVGAAILLPDDAGCYWAVARRQIAEQAPQFGTAGRGIHSSSFRHELWAHSWLDCPARAICFRADSPMTFMAKSCIMPGVRHRS